MDTSKRRRHLTKYVPHDSTGLAIAAVADYTEMISAVLNIDVSL